MYKKVFFIFVVLCLSFMLGMAGCSRKNVRHLASDVGLVTPGTTTKQEVVTYLGQPDAEYKMEEGVLLWVYYEEKKTGLSEKFDHTASLVAIKTGESSP